MERVFGIVKNRVFSISDRAYQMSIVFVILKKIGVGVEFQQRCPC